MIQVSLRIDEETAKFVRREARRRKTNDSVIWRDLIESGVARSDAMVTKIDRLLRISVHNLAMSQKILSLLDRDGVERARRDARHMLARLREEGVYTGEYH